MFSVILKACSWNSNLIHQNVVLCEHVQYYLYTYYSDGFEASAEQQLPSSTSSSPPLSPSSPPPAMAAQRQQVFQRSDCSITRNPLAWDNMPSTLRQQFPHWEKQAFPSPDVNRRGSLDSPGNKCMDSWHVLYNCSIYTALMHCTTLHTLYFTLWGYIE